MFECKQIIQLNELNKKAKLFDENCWKIRCAGNPKIRTYIHFRQSLDTEEYVKYNLSRNERSFMAQIRLGILPLKIETGRFENLVPELRLCEFCPNTEIDDEEHFLFKCELNKELKTKFISTLIRDRSTKCTFDYSTIQLFWKIIFENHPRLSSRYIISAFDNRRPQHLMIEAFIIS